MTAFFGCSASAIEHPGESTHVSFEASSGSYQSTRPARRRRPRSSSNGSTIAYCGGLCISSVIVRALWTASSSGGCPAGPSQSTRSPSGASSMDGASPRSCGPWSEMTPLRWSGCKLSPRYGSFLGGLMRKHVERMRSIGYRYACQESALLRFDHFLQRRADLAASPLLKLLDEWRRCNPSPQHFFEVYKMGRIVSKAMHRLDPDVPILPVNNDAGRRVQQIHRRPYIYTEAQIVRLMEVAQSFESRLAPLRALSLYTMILPIYCAGLRMGELARLTLSDLDLENDTIEICGTKFFKSRRLPLAPGVMVAVKRYLAARRKSGVRRSNQQAASSGTTRAGRGYSARRCPESNRGSVTSFRAETGARQNRPENPRSATRDGL